MRKNEARIHFELGQGEGSMDARLIVLKLFLEALGEVGDITDFNSRKRLQKAVYLGQLSGVDLGYRYSWYLRGPYSTSLTRDYYALADELERGADDHKKHELNPSARKKLQTIRAFLEPPRGCKLDKDDWLELLASWHYLLNVSRCEEMEAAQIMRNQKPRLAQYIGFAKEAVNNLGQ